MAKPLEHLERIKARLDPRQSSLFGPEHEEEIAVLRPVEAPDQRVTEEPWPTNTKSPSTTEVT
jgi:hypothetical protein